MRSFITTLILLLSLSSNAQYYSEWIHLQDQKMFINPAFTAFDDQTEVKLFTKQLFGDNTKKNHDQFFIDNELYLISLELPLKKNKSKVGFSVQSLRNYHTIPSDGLSDDAQERKSFMTDLFYSYPFNDNWRIGASAGIISFKVRNEPFLLGDELADDQTISFSGSIGVVYSTRHWNMGIGYNRLNNPLKQFLEDNRGSIFNWLQYKPNLNFSIDYHNQLRRYRNYLSKSDWQIRVLAAVATYMKYDNVKPYIFNFTVSPRLYYKFLHAGFTYQIVDDLSHHRFSVMAGGTILKDRLTLSLGYDLFARQSNDVGIFGNRNMEAFLKLKF
jgi:hypothetical protein